MDSNDQTIDSKQAFRLKAALFSLLVPLGSVFVGILCLVGSGYFLHNAYNSVWPLIFGILLVVQIFSLVAGVIGLCAKGVPEKIISLVGILISCGVGFVAFIGLDIMIYGIGC